MIKLDFGHVVKTFVEALLPPGASGLLAVSLRVDTWLHLHEPWLKPEALEAFKDDPSLYQAHCQATRRHYEVLAFKRSGAYIQAYLQKDTNAEKSLSLNGDYAKVADHDSQWIECLDDVSANAFEVIESIREQAKDYVLAEFCARLRPGQMVSFAEPPVLINPDNWRISDDGNLNIQTKQ
ncbi:hypothetical protein [Pseudomonas amygdali]|uniref:Uncharacterized protein n=2 Tax=Pseudomonas amygdali pv. lachrymans TaxID=53707 RepID=A0ABR5KTV4_PSEAV|nr:hypothetical protein [Pseudomonas amygdali]AXH59597.1 hypothetical protein PLA107_030705 [Pseudomonas amygdali pv. lachrymans str. M301315]KPC17026.1 Uncharacterized protein AC499_0228 [Pseudomonas amygdali pv. lachrymans]KPC17985.1 Uncharacterized protein AC499_1187 [Pseudomonas amygdali pv. lachrymans]